MAFGVSLTFLWVEGSSVNFLGTGFDCPAGIIVSVRCKVETGRGSEVRASFGGAEVVAAGGGVAFHFPRSNVLPSSRISSKTTSRPARF